MDYTEEDLIDFIARHDEHEDYYRGKLAELRAEHDREVAAEALEDAADSIRHKQHSESIRQMLHARAQALRTEGGA